MIELPSRLTQHVLFRAPDWADTVLVPRSEGVWEWYGENCRFSLHYNEDDGWSSLLVYEEWDGTKYEPHENSDQLAEVFAKFRSLEMNNYLMEEREDVHIKHNDIEVVEHSASLGLWVMWFLTGAFIWSLTTYILSHTHPEKQAQYQEERKDK